MIRDPGFAAFVVAATVDFPGRGIFATQSGIGQAIRDQSRRLARRAGEFDSWFSRAPSESRRVSAPVSFSGLAPQFVGVNRINVTVPQGVAGVVALQIQAGGITTSSQVTIAVSQ